LARGNSTIRNYPCDHSKEQFPVLECAAYKRLKAKLKRQLRQNTIHKLNIFSKITIYKLNNIMSVKYFEIKEYPSTKYMKVLY